MLAGKTPFLRYRLSLVVLLFALFSSGKSSAQEMFGAASSNFAGQMGLDLNPASIVAPPYKWELHLVSLDAAVLNNYMYLKKGSGLIRKSLHGQAISDSAVTDRYTTNPDKWAYASAFVKYPAFIWTNEKLAFGFHVSTRAEVSARGIEYHLAKFIKEGFNYDTLQGIDFTAKNITAAVLNWHEIAATAGYVFYDMPEAFITGAVTLKYNYGLNAAYLKLDNLDYNSKSDSLLVIYDLNAQYGHSLSGSASDPGGAVLKKKGGGFSVDLGMEYYINRNDDFYNPCSKNNDQKPYDIRFGASVIDLGYMTFNKMSRQYSFKNVGTNWVGFDTVKFQNIDHTDTIFGDQFYGSPMAARRGSSFRVYTPAALSVQFDYCFMPRLFVNGSIIQRLPMGPYAVKRTNELSITPRYETRHFEAALPFSVYDYFKPRLGLAFRFGPLTLGTDMLGPFLGITDSYGADFYLALVIKNFGSCDRGGHRYKGKNKIEDCLIPK